LDDLKFQPQGVTENDLLEGYRETELGFLPEEWDVAPLGEHLSLIRNGLSKRQNREGAGYPVTRIETISGDRINPKKVAYLENLSDEQVEKHRLLPGDILFSNINSEPQLGRSVIYEGNPPLLLHGMNLLLLRTVRSLDSDFLSNLLSFYRATGVFIGLAGRAVNQSSINQGKLKAMLIPVPPISEQQAIAYVLRAVQEAKEATEKVIKASRELQRSLMNHLFTYGPVPVGEAERVPLKETEIGSVPAHWLSVKLGGVARIVSGGTPSRKSPEFWNGEIPWVKTGEIRYNTITTTEERISERGLMESSARLLPAGTLLMAMYGQGVTRGRVATLGIDASINQACAAILPMDGLLSRYLYHFFSFD
jgi:type I restriction enzyme, S subunit